MKLVPNEHPTIPSDGPIAIIGEAPGKDEAQVGRPFVGASGNLLSGLLNSAGILRSKCYVGHVCQVTPPDGRIERFSWDGWQIQEGLKQLRADLRELKPNLILLLGHYAAKAAGDVRAIDSIRGSIFQCMDTTSPFYTYKCIATYNPTFVIRSYDKMPLMRFDIERAKEQAEFPDLRLRPRICDVDLLPDQICDKLYSWPEGQPGAYDLEGGAKPQFNGISCCSIASSPEYAFAIDWKNIPDNRKADVYDALRWWLANPKIPKVCQQFMKETFCEAWEHKIPIANIYWDTMLGWWEMYPELPKGLATQASLLTDLPYYKAERKVNDNRTHLLYCCKDTLATFECYEKQRDIFINDLDAGRHFRFNMDLLPQLAYIQLKGFKYDVEGASAMLSELSVEMDELQTRLDVLNGEPINVASPKQMTTTLYKRHGFEPQYQREGGKRTNKLTADTLALLTLYKKYESDFVYDCLRWRHLEGIRKQLAELPDHDNRMRATYNPVGTDTGRFTCYKCDTGKGYNLQTVTKRLRPLFQADSGYYMFQVDLSGADGWTVAAHSTRLGDTRLMDDYLAGVKPAKVICAMHLTGDQGLARLPSEELLDIINNIDIPSWLYNAAKAVQHGSNYGMGKITMSQNILRQSWKHSGSPIYLAPKDCIALQDLYFKRYNGVKKWQSWVKLQLEQHGGLLCASGHYRTFFGRRSDNATYQSALSHEPQANTTYATSLAAHRLWYDPENRRSNGSLIIEPLHQVHDALVGQFPIDTEQWAVDKLKSYFDNEITIADLQLKIPYEGEYGLYWGDNSIGTI